MKKHQKPRNSSGVSLTELLLSALLISLSTAAIGELMLAVVISTNKMTNQFDAVAASRTVFRRIREDVKISRLVASESDAQKLVLKLHNDEFFREDGMPLKKTDPKYPLTPQKMKYYLKEDPDSKTDRPKEYTLWTTRPDKGDTIILKGIIGPRLRTESDSMPPSIFTYYRRQDITSDGKKITPLTSSNGNNTSTIIPIDWQTDAPSNYTDKDLIGVRMDFELYRPYSTSPNKSDGNQAYHKSLAVHSEAFRRANIDYGDDDVDDDVP